MLPILPRRMSLLNLLTALLAVASAASAQDAPGRIILDAYESARPTTKDLAWFSLDWAATLKEAKQRAAQENRPILCLHTNGRGNLWCGFC